MIPYQLVLDLVDLLNDEHSGSVANLRLKMPGVSSKSGGAAAGKWQSADEEYSLPGCPIDTENENMYIRMSKS